MEKKEKAMAARAASVPSFSGLSLGSETCHWLARKQKATNQRKAQKAGVGAGPGSPCWGRAGGRRRETEEPGRFEGASPTLPTHRGRGGGGSERREQGGTERPARPGAGERETPGRRRPGPEQRQGGAGRERGRDGETRDREKSVSLGCAALSSASTGFPAESLTDPA